MYKKRRIIKSVYIVFALIFLLILGMDLYRHIQSKNEDKVQGKTVTTNNTSDKNNFLISNTMAENNETQMMEATNQETESRSFFVAVYQNRIIVYLDDKKTVYEYTNINTNELPLELRAKLSDGFFLNGEEELYHFLESYSS